MNRVFAATLLVSILFSITQIASGQPLPASLTNGLQALWTFNGDANDISGNGNNLTAPNGATYTLAHNGNLAASMNGTNGFFWLPKALITNNSFTWSLWFRTDNPSRPDTIVNQGGPLSGSPQTSPGIALNDPSAPPGITVMGYTYDFGAGDQKVFSSPLALTTNQWASVVWTSDSSGNRALYIDGQLNGTALSQVFGQINENVYIGGVPQIDAYSPTYYFAGQLRDIGIWDRPLTSSEVTALYNAQVVPEPSTYALLLLSGAASLYALKHRRR